MLTTLFGSYNDEYVSKSLNQFVFLPKLNEAGYSEKSLEEVFIYAADRLWYSEVSLTDAIQILQEALLLTDLYNDDADRKYKISDLIAQRYNENNKSPPSFYDPDEDDLRLKILIPKISNGRKYGFGELTKAYDIQYKLVSYSVRVSQYGDIDDEKDSYGTTDVRFRYDSKLSQSQTDIYQQGRKWNREEKRSDWYYRTESITYLGDVRILGVAKTEKEDKIYYVFNGIKYIESPLEARDRIVKAVTGQKVGQLLYIILSNLVNNRSITRYDFIESGFHFDSGKVRVKMKEGWPTKQDMPLILKLINKFYTVTTNPNAFRVKLYFDLLGPLSYDLRNHGLLFPILFLWGKTRGGKTQLLVFMNTVGWDNPKANLTEKNMETKFTALKQLSNKRVGLMIDEVSMPFLSPLEHYLNSATTGVGSGSRGGKGSDHLELWEYEVLSWLSMTTNDTIPLGGAFNNRIIIVPYDDTNVERQNEGAFQRIKEEFPRGWMYTLSEEMWGGSDMKDNISQLVQGTVKEDEYMSNIFNTAEKKIKEIYQKYGVEWIMDGDLQFLRRFPANYHRDVFQFFRQAAEWTEQTVFKGHDSSGNEIPVDKFDKYGLNIDFWREDKEIKVIVNEKESMQNVEAYFVTPKAFSQFAREAELPKQLRNIESFAEYIKKPTYVKITSRRKEKQKHVKGKVEPVSVKGSPIKGLWVLDPEIKLPTTTITSLSEEKEQMVPS